MKCKILLIVLLIAQMSAGSAWVPPIGTPSPTFGINEDVRALYGPTSGARYDYQDDAPVGPVPYRLTAAGDPYTHYIDPSSPNATDLNNPNGSEDKPRMTIPTSYEPGTMANGTMVPRVRLKKGSVVHIQPTSSGVSWNFGFTSGFDGTLRTHTQDAIGIGTATQPIFIRGPEVNRRSKILMNREQNAPNTEYVIFENLFFDGKNHNVKWPFTYNGTFPPVDPLKDPDVNDHYSFRITSRSNHLALRGCEFSGATYYDFRYVGLRGSALVLDHKDDDPTLDLSNIVIYQCKIGPNAWGASASTANAAPGWTGVYPPEYGDKTYPWKEYGLIGIMIGNNVHNIWILDNECFGNGDSILCGMPGTRPGPQYWPTKIFISGNNFHDDQENNIDIKGGKYVVISMNSFSGVHRSANTSNGAPYERGVNNLIAGGGGGEAVRINDEGANGFIWIVNNAFQDCTNAITQSRSSFTYANPSTWGSVYVIGNLITGMDRDPVFFPTFRNNPIDGPAGEASAGDGWAFRGTMIGDFWFVNNTIDRCARGVKAWNIGNSHVLNNVFTNRLYNSDRIERSPYEDFRWNDLPSQRPPGGFLTAFTPNLVYPAYLGSTLLTPQISDPKYVNDSVEMPSKRDYRVQAVSPAVDAGTDPSVIYSYFMDQFGIPLERKDIRGVVRPQGEAWDLGAFEFVLFSKPSNPPKRLQVTPVK